MWKRLASHCDVTQLNEHLGVLWFLAQDSKTVAKQGAAFTQVLPVLPQEKEGKPGRAVNLGTDINRVS